MTEAQAGQWRATAYGITDGTHEHHCMVTPDEETAAYLNAHLAQPESSSEQEMRRALGGRVHLSESYANRALALVDIQRRKDEQ